MSGLPASKPSAAPRPQARDGVAGMGYRLAAGGLAGRLRAGDGGTGPCLEDAWVKRTARFWMDISQVAARALPMGGVARSLATARASALTRLRHVPALKFPAVKLPSTDLPILDICQGAAALTVIAIGSSTLVCWTEAHQHRQPPARPQAAAMVTPIVPARVKAQPVREASLPPPPNAAAAIANSARGNAPAPPSPPPVVAAPAPAVIASPVLAPPPPAALTPLPPAALADVSASRPPSRPSRPMHAARAQEAAPAPRLASAPRIALAPRIFTVLATRPMPRPHRAPHAVAAQYEMPHWLTEPRAPLVMSEPPHALSLPPQYAQQPQSLPRPYQAAPRYTPPLLERPRVDRFAEGSYVPPMMPGIYQ